MIVDDVLSQLDRDVPVKDIRQGVFHTGVWTRHCGLAASLPRDALQQTPPLVREPGQLLKKSALELTQFVYSERILEAAMGMACLNSLLQVPLDDCRERNAAEIILEKGQGNNVAIVGHFPFISKVREVARQVWVIEKNPGPGDLQASEAETYLPRADLVAITGTAFTNHSIDTLLSWCDPGAYVLILGDSAPMTRVLFAYGIDAVAGTWVADPELALRCVSQGANFRQIQGVKRLTLCKHSS